MDGDALLIPYPFLCEQHATLLKKCITIHNFIFFALIFWDQVPLGLILHATFQIGLHAWQLDFVSIFLASFELSKHHTPISILQLLFWAMVPLLAWYHQQNQWKLLRVRRDLNNNNRCKGWFMSCFFSFKKSCFFLLFQHRCLHKFHEHLRSPQLINQLLFLFTKSLKMALWSLELHGSKLKQLSYLTLELQCPWFWNNVWLLKYM